MDCSVLVVDDDPGIREALELVLQEGGYAVSTAADGLEALERLRAEPAGLLVLDWSMPRLDGAGLLGELRRRGLRAGLPVLLLTAANAPHEKAAAVGADACLEKPFGLDELLAEVARLLRERPTGAPPIEVGAHDGIAICRPGQRDGRPVAALEGAGRPPAGPAGH